MDVLGHNGGCMKQKSVAVASQATSQHAVASFSRKRIP